MSARRLRALSAAARALGLSVRVVEPGTDVVSTGTSPHLRLARVGRPELHAHVLVDRRTLRRRPDRYQNAMGRHLGQEHRRWLFRELGVNCVLDVGANTGQFAASLRAAGYRGRIVSFEPVAAIHAALSERAADDPEWHTRQHALGEVEEETEINVGGTLSSILPSSDFGREWSTGLRLPETETISVRRLDQTLDEAVAGIDQPRVFLKLDTQGFDLHAFRGGGTRLRDLVVAMQSEVACVPIYDGMPGMTEALEAYREGGYAVSAMFPVSMHRATLRMIELDAILVREPQA